MMLRLCTAAVLSTFLCATAFANDPEKRQVYKEFEKANGNTVQVIKRGETDHEGNAKGSRRYRITNEDGQVVSRGADRVRKTDDGRVVRAKKRTRIDDKGNVHQRRAHGQKDADGNRRGQRHGRKLDADGNVVARAKDRGRKSAAGNSKRRTVKQRKAGN